MPKRWGVVFDGDEAHVMSEDPKDACSDGLCGGCDSCVLRQCHHYGRRIINVTAADPEAAEAAARALEALR